jgi:hypothetical protein
MTGFLPLAMKLEHCVHLLRSLHFQVIGEALFRLRSLCLVSLPCDYFSIVKVVGTMSSRPSTHQRHSIFQMLRAQKYSCKSILFDKIVQDIEYLLLKPLSLLSMYTPNSLKIWWGISTVAKSSGLNEAQAAIVYRRRGLSAAVLFSI